MGALGIPPDQLGNGLTPLQHRRILWAHWATGGVISGCEVQGTSGMSYRVLAGAVVMQIADREAVEVGVNEITVTTEPAAASRVDYIQVDTEGQVYATAAPIAGRLTLDVRSVPAGVTATTSTTGVRDRGYAVASTGMLGVLDRWDETRGHLVALPARETLKTGRFVVPGDRRMMVELRHSVTAQGYTDPIGMPIGGTTGAMLYTITVDEQQWRLPVYHGRTWQSQTDEIDFWVTAGEHTWTVTREQWAGTPGITLGNGPSRIPTSYVKIVDQGATA